jgi:hypothetical protein
MINARADGTLASAIRTLATVIAGAYLALWGCCASSECATGADCASGYCLGYEAGFQAGTCCNTACTGPCESCGGGTCLPTKGVGLCASDGTVCGGTCDGVHTECNYPGSAVQCRAPSCDPTTSTATLAAVCNGSGSCPAVEQQACAPATCGATQCQGCTGPGTCAANQHCAGGVCVANLPVAAACGSSAECASGFCVDGVCCGSACTAQCEACNVTGHEGACVPVMGSPVGGRPRCVGYEGTTCGGSCNGTDSDACSYPAAGTECPNDQVCAGGGQSCACLTGVTDVCDGEGRCWAPPAIRCMNCGDGGTAPEAGPDAGPRPGTEAGAGPEPQAEGGATSEPAPEAGPDTGFIAGGGCNCRAAPGGPGDGSWLAGLAATAFVLRGSRRRRLRGRRRA